MFTVQETDYLEPGARRTVVVKFLCADAASKHGSLTWTPVKMRFSARIGPPVTWSPQHGEGLSLW